jgi:putative SOS response-associated peptidase YedK
MCGRYSLIAYAEAIRLLFELPSFDERLVSPRYNISPTQPIVIVREGAKGRELVPVRWGLIPWWVNDLKNLPLLINARAEQLAEKPAFRDAFKYRRCLVPASGFYEWETRGRGPKKPFAAMPRNSLIAFAGLFETWHGPDGSEIDTAAIVTTDASEDLRPIHGRMPVVLHPEDYATWLSRDTALANAQALLRSAAENFFELVPISTRINSADNDDPRLLDRDDSEPEGASSPKPKPDPRQMQLF